MQLRTQLFENPCVIKIEGCQYNQKDQEPNLVIIYYDELTDLFAIVDSKSNVLLNFSIATEVDYANIFYYKSISEDRFVNETRVFIPLRSNQTKPNLNPLVDQCEAPNEKENVLSNEEAIDLFTKTYGSKYMAIDNGNYKISDWQTAKKIYHSSIYQVKAKDSGFQKSNLDRIYDIGLTKYVMAGGKLPSQEYIQAYQTDIKNFCEDQTR